ncbi:hypothetical protein MSAN_01722400 [Mycena sanguinolenta]|uniref:Hydrophobic surface binding protein A-domain-containing protein n=1 Tax=Mycena sanguinolenta TaxID=230812 RepID=A0A8H6XXD3_9AGAR|nr:hypothetical protein MSAN_01722400 [Mycena sanguinolenta]
MVQFTRLFVSLCLIAASVSSPTKRTAAQVEADIAKISSQATAWDKDIKGFPDSGMLGFLKIDLAAESLESSLKTATSDVKANGALSEADGTTILSEVQAILPVILDALARLTAEKPSFAALLVPGIPAVVLADLKALNASTDAFANALLAAAPVRPSNYARKSWMADLISAGRPGASVNLCSDWIMDEPTNDR